MNIIIQDINGAIKCRPDTTWERENKDLYSPDFVTGYSFAPVLFARVCKAGKFVGAKFAGRYYDAVGYGVLLYPEVRGTLMSIMDRTSLLPGPMYNRLTLESGENVFNLNLDGERIWSTSCGSGATIEEAIVNVSKLISVRIGDIVAVELSDIAPLFSLPGAGEAAVEHRLEGTFCGNWLFDMLIK